MAVQTGQVESADLPQPQLPQQTQPEQPKRHNRAAIIGLCAAVFAGVAFVAYAVSVAQQRAGAPMTSAQVGLIVYPSPRTVPSFSLSALGTTGHVTPAVLGRGPAVVNFFASWCTACQAELGTFASVARQDRAKLHFLGIDFNDYAPAQATAMLARAGADYPVGVSKSLGFASAFGVGEGLPTTVLIDPQGKAVGEVLGKLPRSQLVHVLDELAAGKPLTP